MSSLLINSPFKLLPLTVAVMTACSNSPEVDGSGAAWRADIDTIGDTIIVNTLRGSERNDARLVEELRIGSIEGQEHEVFGNITALAVGPAGEILVYDDQAVALRRYDSSGRYLSRIGGPGAGPGEYQNVAGIAALENGRIVVYDFGNGRFNVYTSAGELLDTWPLRTAVAERRPLHPDGAGGIFLHDRRLVAGETTREEILVHVSDAGALGDTLNIPFTDYRPPGLEVRTARSSVGMFIPFTATSEWTVTARGELVTMLGNRYAIDVRRPGGRILRITRTVEPVPVSDEERAAEEERITARFRRVLPDWRWDGPSIPSTKPLIRWLHSGTDTTIWVSVSSPGQAIPEAGRLPNARSWVSEPLLFDVFRADGRFVGRVHGSPEMQLLPYPVFGRDHVWAVVNDENGVDFVARFRVVSQ